MSEVDDHFVKRGLWTNLAHGPVMGKIITTDIRTGTIVIAILAVVSSLGTAHLWHLLAFTFHQWRADGLPSDGLFRQQQALLRTLPGPSSLLADSTKLYWLWRKRTDRALAKSIVLFILAILCAIGSLAAGIASSYIVDTTNLEVLVSSPFCATMNQSSGATTSATGGYKVAVDAVAQPYADECYRNSTSLPIRCRIFSKPFVPFSVERTECPWASDICVGPNDKLPPAVAVDSGLVDVNHAFGLNLGEHDQVRFRKRTTCGILPVDGYSMLMNASDFPPGLWKNLNGIDPLPGQQVLLLEYGQRQYLDEWSNVTASYNLLSSNITNNFMFWGLNHQPAKGPHNAFTPLEDMQRNDTDIALLVVSKHSIIYANPSDDLLFGSHKPNVQINFDTGENQTYYLPDNLFNAVGCAQQYQFCANDHCSRLGDLPLNISQSDFPQASPLQLAALNLLHYASYSVDISDNNALTASSLIENGWVVQSQIPDDQWITEIKGWESYVWASLQTIIADYAIGPKVREPQAASDTVPPSNVGEKQLCGEQKMRKQGGFVNINVFGLVFTVTLSLTAAILDITILKFLVFLSRFRRALAPRLDRWVQDGVLQLQRRAYEAQGEGTWHDLNKDVPLTRRGEKLSDLTVETRSRFKFTAGLGLSGMDSAEDIENVPRLRRSQTEATVTSSLASTTLKEKISDEDLKIVPKLRRFETEGTLVGSPTLTSPQWKQQKIEEDV